MKSTRDRILQTLLTEPQSTIQSLADAVGINTISVRHHLKSLKADNLVVEEEIRHGIGRPRLVYALSEQGRMQLVALAEQGLERFPTRYLRLTTRILTQLKETLPETVYRNIFTQMASSLASDYANKASKLPLEERLNYLQDALTDEGFSIEWSREGDKYIIREVSCPYLHIGQSHPEICLVDQTLISSVLSIPAEKIQCLLSGDGHCAFTIPAPANTEKKS